MGEGVGGLGDLGDKILETASIPWKPATALVLLCYGLSYLVLTIYEVDGGTFVFLGNQLKNEPSSGSGTN